MSGDAVPVRLIAVGDELLEGRTSDTNSTRVQRALGAHAASVRGIEVVPDRETAIAAALGRTDPGDLVIVYGGLGSTVDDLTREAVAAWADVPLERNAAVAERLVERLAARGFTVGADTLKQAQVPRGLDPVTNPVGSAPGLVGSLAGRWLVVLPGVPQELAALLPDVVARLHEAGILPAARQTRLWRTAQVAEMPLARLCEPVRQAFPELGWAFWLVDWGVDVRLFAPDPDPSRLEAAAARLDDLLGDLVYAHELVSLPACVLDLARDRGQTLAVAESCTGGMLGSVLTGVPGSSAVFRGGVLAYADPVKEALLGVAAADLSQTGAVSEPVAVAMARGARERLGTDHALAITGIAGPGGGTPEKPVGTVWIGLAGPERSVAFRYRFGADRDRNRRLAVAAALDLWRRTLTERPVGVDDRFTWTVRP